MTAPTMPVITITTRAGARIVRGHRWVFSNEVVREEDGINPGTEVRVVDEGGQSLGTALYNRQSLIRARLYTGQPVPFDEEFVRARLLAAAERRHRLYPGRRVYRLVFSESDSLPGLVIDRYDSVYVVQFLTLAIDQRREMILRLVDELFQPATVVERNDVPAREYEGLPLQSAVLKGEVPSEFRVEINGISMRVDPLSGQKTGLFLDQVENWKLMDVYTPGKKVLDLFCNTGGFALRASRAGASSVKAVDSSELALSAVLFNAQANNLQHIRGKATDAFLYVRSRPEDFDVIVCDPPAFAKSRKHTDAALRGYRELNRWCMKMLTPGGILITCSCSAAISSEDFDKMLGNAARDAERVFRSLPGGCQPADHAPILAMQETLYLKVRVLEALD